MEGGVGRGDKWSIICHLIKVPNVALPLDKAEVFIWSCLKASESKGWFVFYSRDCSEKENRLYEIFHVKASACKASHNVSWCLHDGRASAGKQKKGECLQRERTSHKHFFIIFFLSKKCSESLSSLNLGRTLFPVLRFLTKEEHHRHFILGAVFLFPVSF